MVTLSTQLKISHTWAVYSSVRATPDQNISGALDSRPVHWKDSTVSGVRASSVSPRSSAWRIYSTCVLPILLYGSETWTLIQADWNKLDPFHVRCQRRILHIRWHDFISNDQVLHRTGLFDVSYIVRKQRLGLFGHVARLRRDVPANQILQICTKSRDGERPSQEWRRACGRPSTTWTHQICRDMGVTATEALQLAEDRLFWRTIATAGGSG